MTTDVLDVLNKLPPIVYTTLISDPCQVIAIKRGVSGYYHAHRHHTAEFAQKQADRLNAGLATPPTKAQIVAMEGGSMFGWDAPIADIDRIDADGKPIL